MKRYKPLLEKRRNPDRNPYVGAWDYLLEYKDDPDVYISFTKIDKIGINPKSGFNTPVGIYTYPLKEFYNLYIKRAFDLHGESLIPKTYSIGFYAPWAGKSKYINFIKIKKSAKANFIEDMYKDYGSDKYDRDIKILKDKYAKKDVTALEVKKFINDLINHLSQLDPNDNNITILDDIFEIVEGIDVNNIFDKLPTIHQSGVLEDSLHFFKENNLEKLHKILSIYLYEVVGQGFSAIIEKGLRTAKKQNSIMSMWNITKLLSEDLAMNIKSPNTKPSVKWNTLLSKDLGYSGFADKSGKGYLHPSEPMQAIFLNTRAFDLLHRVENKPNKKSEK